MANKNLFKSTVSSTKKVQATTTVNEAGGVAYQMTDKAALAQIAATNCFNGTYYTDEKAALELAKNAVSKLKNNPEYIAKVAVFSREHGYMKDMPAYLTVVLAGLDTKLFRKVFRKVVDNGKMLRNVIQIARSGQTGKTYNMSSGTWRHAIQEWFDNRNGASVFHASIGNDPSMNSILRMAHPSPRSKEKYALFGYLLGLEYKFKDLPENVQKYEKYKKDRSGDVPEVDFRYLDSLGLGTKEWTQVALRANWTMTRMNLNTFMRHGVFEDGKAIQKIADKLRDPEQIAKARVFPYQLLQAYKSATDVPHAIRDALQDAMETATNNVPEFPGEVYVCVDVSGSMGMPATGNRGTATSKVRCVDVAAVFAASVLRKNRSAVVYPFDDRLHDAKRINSRDSIMTNADTLARFGGGGTDCSLPVRHFNQNKMSGDAIVFVSDNESWVDTQRLYYYSRGTGLMNEWVEFKKRNPKARLVCIDLLARDNAQVTEHKDILQVGGFSDQVFGVVDSFLRYGHETNHWVSEIERISLD